MQPRHIVSTCALVALCSCSVDEMEIGRERQAIINGDEETDPAYDAVVAVYYETMGLVCSGTLIAPRTVMMQSFCAPDGPSSDLEVRFGPSSASPEATIEVTTIFFHPDYNPTVLDSPQIAVARLADDAPEGIAPIPALPASLGLTDEEEGIALTWVGYGTTSGSSTTNAGTRRQVDAPIVRVCDDGTECGGQVGIVEIDVSAGGPCYGDGPGFIERSGTLYLAAIEYMGDQYCATVAYATTVSAHEDFLASVFGECGQREDCLTSFCVDGLCCDSACDGECGRCDLESAPGICMPEEDGSPCDDGVCEAGACVIGMDGDEEADMTGDGVPDMAPDTLADLGADATDSAETSSSDTPSSEEGCECQSVPFSGAGSFALLVMLLAFAGRRRRTQGHT